jgi:DNA-binding CsgD family transcriptional regulator
MVATDTHAPCLNDDTVRALRAVTLLISAVQIDDSGQAQRELRRVSQMLSRVAARAWARVQTVPERPAERVPCSFGPRESAITKLLAEGRSYKDIAVALKMGLSSVSTRVKSIYLKLGVHSRLGLQQRMLAPVATPPALDERAAMARRLTPVPRDRPRPTERSACACGGPVAGGTE